MEKRILLAFALSLAVMYLFRFVYSPPSETPAVPSAASSPSAPATPSNTPVPTPTPTPAPVATATAQPLAEAVQEDRSEDFQVEMPLYTVTFSNHGAVLKSFRPKGYLDTEGHPIELIDVAGAAKVGWPLAIT